METSILNEAKSVTGDGWLTMIKKKCSKITNPLKNHVSTPRKKQKNCLEVQNH